MGRTAVDNNGEIFQGRIFPDLAETFIAVLAWHVQIKEQKVGLVFMKESKQLLCITNIGDMDLRIVFL